MPNRPYYGPTDRYEFTNRSAGKVFPDQSFNGETPPSPSGIGNRQNRLQPRRAAINTRHVLRWLVPEQPIIEMYINPKQISYSYTKITNENLTKGGYLLQYWGEALTTLTIIGSTGTSGIEGINILKDVYRNEQLMFDPYALLLESRRQISEQNSFDDFLGLGGLVEDASILGAALGVTNQNKTFTNNRAKPTLASLAYSVEMYWMGAVYRGFFKSFSFTESADQIGLFDYNISFTVTQERGYRQNFFGWHKTPNGVGVQPPDNRPYSFGALTDPGTNSNPNLTGPGFQDISSETTESRQILNNSIKELDSTIDSFNVF